MRTSTPDETSSDQGHDPLAQRLITLAVISLQDLKPDFKIWVNNEKGRIRFGAASQAIQEPPLVRMRVFRMKARIEALD